MASRYRSADVGAARAQGATDIEIHDTVLIAAAFCMYNRYVDGLGTWQPRDESMYAEMGKTSCRAWLPQTLPVKAARAK